MFTFQRPASRPNFSVISSGEEGGLVFVSLRALNLIKYCFELGFKGLKRENFLFFNKEEEKVVVGGGEVKSRADAILAKKKKIYLFTN